MNAIKIVVFEPMQIKTALVNELVLIEAARILGALPPLEAANLVGRACRMGNMEKVSLEFLLGGPEYCSLPQNEINYFDTLVPRVQDTLPKGITFEVKLK